MRIGSQSMSSTIDPKTICNKEVKQVSPNSRNNQIEFPTHLSDTSPVCGGLALANSPTSTQLLARSPLWLNGEKNRRKARRLMD